jgi:hypothetical protein
MVGSGEGGAEALAKHLTEDGVFYGLVRTTEQIDNSTTVSMVGYGLHGTRDGSV